MVVYNSICNDDHMTTDSIPHNAFRPKKIAILNNDLYKCSMNCYRMVQKNNWWMLINHVPLITTKNKRVTAYDFDTWSVLLWKQTFRLFFLES